MTLRFTRLATPLVVMLLTALAGERATALHDLLGAVAPSREVPSAVIQVEGEDATSAVEAARAAGAAEVWMALPPKHPWLAGARPVALGLDPAADGRIREAAGQRLPLAEALDGLVELTPQQLGRGTLRDMHAVVVFADPARGERVLVPGSAVPVDKGRVAAAAIGSLASAQILHLIPLPLAVLLVGVGALFWQHAAERTTPRGTLWLVAAGVVLSLVLTWVARLVGWDLPIGGLVVAPVLAGFVRALDATQLTWTSLDRLSLRLGRPREDLVVAPGIAGLATVAGLYAPQRTIRAWVRGEAGPTEVQARDGDGQLPPVSTLPTAAFEGPAFSVVPMLEEGEVIGALGIAGANELHDRERKLLYALAATRQFGRRGPDRSDDPIRARIAVAQEAVRRALHRADQWDEVLDEATAPIGLFDVAGGLVSAGGALRAHVRPDGVPLFDVLNELAKQDTEAVRTAVLEAMTEGAPSRLHNARTEADVVVSRMGRGLAPSGFLVQTHDVAPYYNLDQVKSNVIRLLAFQTRNALVSIEGMAVMLAMEEDPDQRQALLDKVQARVERLVELLGQVEGLEVCKVGEAPIQPVFLPELLDRVARKVANDRLVVEAPLVAEPIAAPRAELVEVLVVLIEDLLGQDHEVSLSASVGPRTAEITVADSGGGLPSSVVAGWLEDPDSPPKVARRRVEAMGGEFQLEVVEGSGIRYRLSFPQY